MEDEEVLGTGMMREELIAKERETLTARELLVRLSESRRAPGGDGDGRGSGIGEEQNEEVEGIGIVSGGSGGYGTSD